MNCIEARHQCLNDKECNDVLKMLHKVCGPELVACSSTTPTKCQMLLRTLRNFDYLTSCKCAQPLIDYTCHNFRETIFSHPCGLVETDDYSEYSPALIPRCNDAYEKCRAKGSCLRDYVEFVNVCSFSGITCIAQDSEKCMESWTKIRQSPLFGCTCTPPSSHLRALAYGSQLGSVDSTSLTSYTNLRKSGDQESCLVTYNRTHENPCLDGQHDITKATLIDASQATCHVALEKCHSDVECRPLLDDVMIWCEHAHCEPDRCRTALQEFYDRVSIIHRLQVAFCVCRQSDPDGECLTAMRKLHPTCAEKHSGRDPMKCHKIAEECRKSSICRKKLREYEQRCAADAMTGRCADTHRSCQKAVMNILGTELHATCVCKGTDFLHQHDCYTWQKLLWSNPCVIESHLMLHKEIADGATDSLDEVFRRPTQRTTPPPQHQFIEPTPDEDDLFPPVNGDYGTIREMSPEGRGPRPSGPPYGFERTDTWNKGHRKGLSTGRAGNGRPGNGRDVGLTIGRDYNNPGDPDGVVRVIDSNNGRENNNRRIYTSRQRPGAGSDFTPPKWSKGPPRGGGITLGNKNDRNGGVGSRFGSGNQEETGNPGGRRPGWGSGIPSGMDKPDRVGHFGRNRNRNNGYESPVEEGHRGTDIPSWNKFGGQHQGRKPIWGAPAGGERVPEERVPPTSRPHFDRVTPPPVVGVTPTPPAPPTPTPEINTTEVIPVVTVPRRTCSIKNVKNEQMMNLEIPEGSRRRIYNTSDCSSMCECRAQNRVSKPGAICTTLGCIENKSCNTESAKYPHSAPYYQAYRGDCDCYDGNFICQRPDPTHYDLGPGVYMFLGYSKGEMEILKPVTSKNELDALTQMEDVLIREYGFKCTLKVKDHIGENVIAIAQLNVHPDQYINSFVRQHREKEECAKPLQELAEKINSRPRHSDILTDAHLSMFILAEVDVNYPEAHTSFSSASGRFHSDTISLAYVVTLLTSLLLHCLYLVEAMVAPIGAHPT